MRMYINPLSYPLSFLSFTQILWRHSLWAGLTISLKCVYIQAGRGHWSVKYTRSQSFITMLSYLLARKLCILLLNLIGWCSIQSFQPIHFFVQFQLICIKYINLSSIVLSLKIPEIYIRIAFLPYFFRVAKLFHQQKNVFFRFLYKNLNLIFQRQRRSQATTWRLPLIQNRFLMKIPVTKEHTIKIYLVRQSVSQATKHN